MSSSLQAQLRRRRPSLRLGQSELWGGPNPKEKRSTSFKDTIRRRPTLKELEEKKYLFPDSHLLGLLDNLLEKGVIQLSELKRLEEVGRTDDPKYCRYHKMVSHPLEKCVMLREQIMRLIKDGTVILDLVDKVKTNHISAKQKDCLSFSLEV